MSNFSSAIVLTDLNDFISPGLECTKPVTAPNTATLKTGSTTVSVSKDGKSYYEITKDSEDSEPKLLEKAQITLNDCLACSGCITSAESVLIQMQSVQELTSVLEKNKQLKINANGDHLLVVCSVSAQTRASMGAKHDLPPAMVWEKLNDLFLKDLGVDYLLDVDFAREISIRESSTEFLQRFCAEENSKLPMLTSSCPGWVCYAEKTHPKILPLLDTTKSPQQVMGTLVKTKLWNLLIKAGLAAETDKQRGIYHFSIMPCYDKKLEASRSDFYHDLYGGAEVELVISSLEVEELMESRKLVHVQDVLEQRNQLQLFQRYPWFGGSSGGNLVHVLCRAVQHLHNITIEPIDITNNSNGISTVHGRNSDMSTIYYTPPGSAEPTLKFAYVYGFKNIQNMVRKLKISGAKRPFDFVEVMACPSGCINGGGQLKKPGLEPNMKIGAKEGKEWIQKAEEWYQRACYNGSDASGIFSIDDVLSEWAGSEEFGTKILKTEFHAVQSNAANGLVVKW